MLIGPLHRREPAAGRVRRARARWCLAAVWLLALGGCGQAPTAPTPLPPPVEFITYEGLVFEPAVSERGSYWGDGGYRPIPGARVTILGGQPNGWTVVTDAEGRFAFEDYPYCELESAECRSRLFRVQKAGYETRELGASDPYRYVSSSNLRYSAYEKRIPMSRAWPADPQIQRMLRDLPAMRPLWLVERPELEVAGTYVGGVIRVRSLEWLNTIGHEYCHAHQDWTLDPDRYNGDGQKWLQTLEGRAFVAAWEADRPTDDPFLLYVEMRSSRRRTKSPSEEAAEICSHYFYEYRHWMFGTVGRAYLRDHLPHLHAWGAEWLRRR